MVELGGTHHIVTASYFKLRLLNIHCVLFYYEHYTYKYNIT